MPQQPARIKEILKAAGVESQLELLLLNRLERAGLPVGQAQMRIVPGRRWKWDRAWPEHRVAVEVQGGIYSRSGDGHNRPSKIENDCRKAAAIAALGWRVLPITEKMIREGLAVDLIAAALGVELPSCPASPSRRPAATGSSARAEGAGRAATTAAGPAPAISATGQPRRARAAPVTASSAETARRPAERASTTAATMHRSPRG